MERIIEVEVIEIRSGGVLVKMLGDDRRTGFIRWRELSWDRSINATIMLPGLHEKFDAKIIKEPKKKSRYVPLSIRHLTDPWKDIESKYEVGQSVRGEVVHVRHFGVFVQLEPGITAILWPRNIPLLRNQRHDQVLFLGDHIAGVITHIHLEKKQMQISLTGYLQKISFLTPDFRKIYQDDLLQNKSATLNEASDTGFPKDEKREAIVNRPQSQRPLPEQILIVDDNEDDLDEICLYLAENFDFEIYCAASGLEAQKKLGEDSLYDLVIMDLNLGDDEDGVEVASAIRAFQDGLNIILTSSAPLDDKKAERIKRQGFPFVLKDPELLAGQIEAGVSEERQESIEFNLKSHIGETDFVREMGMTSFANRLLPEVLTQLLIGLRRETKISYAFVVEVESVNEKASIVTVQPNLSSDLKKHLEDGLYFSPVKNVLENEKPFEVMNINQKQDKRFQNFFSLLDYQACLCLPLKIPGLVTHHVLVLLNEERPDFTQEDRNKASITALMLQVALERDALLGFMQRYEQRYSMGQLLNSMVHEVNNKLDTLRTLLETLPFVLQEGLGASTLSRKSQLIEEAQVISQETLEAEKETAKLVKAYSRLAKGDLEVVDVNQVVQKVIRQMETMARDERIDLEVNLQPNIPLAPVIQVSLEQIIINVMLNAIQQISNQRKAMAQIAAERSQSAPLLQQGLILVQTRYNTETNPYSLQIAITDTGPGIHYHQQEQIFHLDTSLRAEGHGLGLFISRNLISRMNGRLRLLDSVMFTGSAFSIELRPATNTGE